MSEPGEESTVFKDLAAIHEQVRQFVEREAKYTCKVTSIYSNARTRYKGIPFEPIEASSNLSLFDTRMTFDVDAIAVQHFIGMQVNYQVEAVYSDKMGKSTLIFRMRGLTAGGDQ